jgi:transposase
MARARIARDEWRKRVQRWKESGLSAKDFAAEAGLNAGTLQVWRSKLKHDDAAPTRRPRRSPSAAILSSLIEVRAPAVTMPHVDQRFEIELANGRRIRVGHGFEVASLRTLVTALEAT